MRAPAAESVAPSLIDDSANLFGKDSIVHQRETDDSTQPCRSRTCDGRGPIDGVCATCKLPIVPPPQPDRRCSRCCQLFTPRAIGAYYCDACEAQRAPQPRSAQRPVSLPGAAADEFEEDDLDVGQDEDPADEGVADVVDDAPPVRRPAVQARGYKPGTRQLETNKNVITGARPWWGAPRGDAVWTEKAEQFKAKGGIDVKNIIGWRDTGLTGGAGR